MPNHSFPFDITLRPRHPLEPLNGKRNARHFRGIGYPHVGKGSTFMKQVKVSLSKESQEQHLHFDDPVIKLHDEDFDLSQFIGLPLRRMHNKKDGKDFNYGDIGVIDGATINKDRELEVWGSIYGNTENGYDAIADYDHGDLTGLSIQYHNHVADGSNLMLGKTIEEMSLTDTGGAHYDSCLVTVSCSKFTATKNDGYSTNNDGKSINYNDSSEERGIMMNDNSNSNNNNASQGNAQNMSSHGQGNNPNTQSSGGDQHSANPLGDTNVLGGLINELKGQVKSENEAKKGALDKLAENEKMMMDMQKNLKTYQDKEKKAIEEKNEEILKDLPSVLNVLGSAAGIKDGELNEKTVELIKRMWTDPEHQQFLNMTKTAALQLAEYQKEKKEWTAQRKQLGLQVNSTRVAVPASQARMTLDYMKEDERKERLRQQKVGLSFDDVYTSQNNTKESETQFGSRYDGLFSSSNYGSWGSTMKVTPNIQTSNIDVPIVQSQQTTQSFPMFGGNTQVNTIAVGASATRRDMQNQQQVSDPYTPLQGNLFPSSINRFSWGKSDFNDAFSMSRRNSKNLCSVTVHKGDAPMIKGDRF